MRLSLEQDVMVDEEKWYLFDGQYRRNDRTYSFYFYARSFDDAEDIIKTMRETAVLSGQIVGNSQEENPTIIIDD